MKRLLGYALVVAFLPSSPWSARATTFDTGVPNILIAPGTNGPCATFQIGTVNQSFALPASDTNYVDEFSLLHVAQSLGKPVTFTDAGTTVVDCQGYELATDIRLGTPPCKMNGTFDFTYACDAFFAGAL